MVQTPGSYSEDWRIDQHIEARKWVLLANTTTAIAVRVPMTTGTNNIIYTKQYPSLVLPKVAQYASVK